MKPLRIRLLTALGSCVLLAACGAGSDGEGRNLAASESGNGLAPLSQRLNQEQGYVRDSSGQWVPRNNRRSQFENRTASGIDRHNNPFSDQRFGTREYRAAEWTRSASDTPREYDGDTDGSRFQTTAAAQGRAHRDASARARTPGEYRTSGFRTGASREDGARRHDRPEHAHTQYRRESFVEPEIIDWRQQRDLGIDQTRSMLAR